MKYSEWTKKYCTKDTGNPIEDLFYGFSQWRIDRPEVAVPDSYNMHDVFNILFSNGITQG